MGGTSWFVSARATPWAGIFRPFGTGAGGTPWLGVYRPGEIPPELRVPMPRHPSPEGVAIQDRTLVLSRSAPPPVPVLNQLIQDGGEAGYAILVRGDSSVPMPRHPSPEGATYPRIGPWSYPEAPPPAPVLNQLIQDGGEAGYAILVRGDSSGIVSRCVPAPKGRHIPMPRHPSPEGATYPRIGPWSYPEAPPPAPVLNQLIQDGGEANPSFPLLPQVSLIKRDFILP
jgi:hypothetical protein